MGNRAVIAFDEYNDDAIGLYLHWNGGRDSIEGFLKATKKVMESRGKDKQYAKARFAQVIGVFLGGNMSFGMGKRKELECDNGDNGVYVIDTENLEIIDRVFFKGAEQNDYDAQEIADSIIKKINAYSGMGD